MSPRYVKNGFLHICENQDTDQLRSKCAADQGLCFRFTALPKYEISSQNFCYCTAWFVSDQVGNPEDWFYCQEAHIYYKPS